jgi:microcystin-dependent protein
MPLRSSPGVELPSGALIQGTPYVVSYNNTDGAFYLQGGFANPYSIPLGGLLPYTASTAPNSAFVLPFGQSISRSIYATYFEVVGTTFGAGDGSTTFNIPDLRGRAVFGQDSMGGGPIGRITVAGGNFDGTVIGGSGGAQNQTLTQAQLPAIKPAITVTDPGHLHSAPWSNVGSYNQSGGAGVAAAPGNSTNTTTATTGITAAFTSNLGSGNSVPILPPAMVLPYILRVI